MVLCKHTTGRIGITTLTFGRVYLGDEVELRVGIDDAILAHKLLPRPVLKLQHHRHLLAIIALQYQRVYRIDPIAISISHDRVVDETGIDVTRLSHGFEVITHRMLATDNHSRQRQVGSYLIVDFFTVGII